MTAISSEGSEIIGIESWRSTIPIQLTLGEGESSSLEDPPPLYFLLPWRSYLHTLLDEAMPLIRHVLPRVELTPWFAYRTLPLKFHLPVGVLYDLIVPDHIAPWHITLHFRNYPSKTIVPYIDDTTLKQCFRNSLKEAAYICQGMAGVQRIMGMTQGSQDEYWRAVIQANRDQYTKVIKSLALRPIPFRGNRAPSIPARIYTMDTAPGAFLSSYDGIYMTSRPLPIVNEDNSPVTLRNALEKIFDMVNIDDALILVAGVQPPCDAPLVWLHDMLCCADHFLYIVIHHK